MCTQTLWRFHDRSATAATGKPSQNPKINAVLLRQPAPKAQWSRVELGVEVREVMAVNSGVVQRKAFFGCLKPKGMLNLKRWSMMWRPARTRALSSCCGLRRVCAYASLLRGRSDACRGPTAVRNQYCRSQLASSRITSKLPHIELGIRAVVDESTSYAQL